MPDCATAGAARNQGGEAQSRAGLAQNQGWRGAEQDGDGAKVCVSEKKAIFLLTGEGRARRSLLRAKGKPFGTGLEAPPPRLQPRPCESSPREFRSRGKKVLDGEGGSG